MLEMALIAGIAVAVYGLWKTLFSPAGPEQGGGDKKEIALEALSTLWARHRNTVISLEQLAGLWRSQAGLPQPLEAENLIFQHSEIQDFYDQYVKEKTFAETPAGGVVKEILGLLDREGDCTSVANTKGEAECLMDKTAYNVLAGVKLYRHTLNVAEEMIKAFKGSAAMLPKVLIASLGHDLGKIPSFGKTFYSTGDHPLISRTILEGLKGYSKLPYKDEVNKAIADHHRYPKGLLGEKLKEADKDARRMEMAENIQEHLKEAKPESGPEEPLQPPPGTGPGLQKAEKDSIFISHEQREKERPNMKEVPLPWFDAERFLAELKPYINRMDGPRWGAFSMPDGYVYFQAGVLEEVAKKLGRSNPDIALMNSDRELRRNILYSIVCNLRREKEAISRGLIKDGYFGGPFIVRMQDGKELSTYYTPFNAEVFGETVSHLEGLKTGKIQEIEEVRPKIQK
ncbi:MAG: HD domain-containing protein [Desulfobacteraceae bacterium]|nr:HD domain-containing protein [Desulfobacteraceae bacterium]